MIVGIDFGSTLTKIVAIDEIDTTLLFNETINGRDTHYEDVLNKLELDRIKRIMMTGTHSGDVKGDIMGIPTYRVSEFDCNALGARFLTGCEDAIIANIGTGTAFTLAKGEDVTHVGGCGLGGGLLIALNRLALNSDDLELFFDIATRGNLDEADIEIKDIQTSDLDELTTLDVTVANMAKLTNKSAKEDIAAGICNMVFQNIGVMSVMTDRAYNTGNVIFLGKVMSTSIAKTTLSPVGDLFGCKFHYPEYGEYGVAIGATLMEPTKKDA